MATAEHYDVVVVGRTAAGLLTAALLARRKRRVRVMPGPTDPAVPRIEPPLFGLHTSPCLRRILDELGLVHTLRTRLEGEPRPLTVALPDRRFSVPAEIGARSRALARAFPGDEADLLRLYDRIEGFGAGLDALLDGELEQPPETFSARRAWRKRLQGLPVSQLADGSPPWCEAPAVQGLVAALATAAGRADDPTGPISAGAARALWHLAHGIAPVAGGRAGFLDMISEKLKILGGVDDANRAAQRLERGGRRVVAAHHEPHRYGAKVFVHAGPDAELDALLGEAEGPLDDVHAGWRARVPLPRAERPVDLVDPCVWQPTPGRRAALLRLDDEALALRWSGEPPPLDELLPFTAARLEAPEPDPWPVVNDPTALYRRPLGGRARNLLRVGPWVMPGLGLEADAVTAWQAAHLAERMLPRLRAR